MFPDVLKGFIVLTLIFVPLERLWSVQSRPVLRRQWATDVFYYFSGYFIGRLGTGLCVVMAMTVFSQLVSADMRHAVANQPLGWQFVEAVLIGEVGYYTIHRLQHTVPWLWQFHAIHHSAESLDWLITVRMHPVDQFMAKIVQVLPLYVLGFSTQLFTVYALFSAAMAFFIHANLRLRFGWLNWLITTPEFHRWHHANQSGIRNKNLAAQLPILDLLFGSFYLPNPSEPQLPLRYGIRETVPSGYVNHLLYPFPWVTVKLQPRLKTMQMTIKRWLKPLLRPLPLLLLLLILGGGTVMAAATAQHLSVPMFLTSLHIPRVTVAQLQQGQVGGKAQPVILLDVRSPEEHEADHIAGSVSVPISDIEAGFGVERVRAIAQALPNQPQPTVVIYCATGPRSIQAYNALAKTGLPMVVLTGGFDQWRSQIPAPQDGDQLAPIPIAP